MTAHARYNAKHGRRTAHRFGVAAVALGIGIGIAAAGGQAAAWADTGHADSSANSSSQSGTTAAAGPRRPVDGRGAHRGGPATGHPAAAHANSTAPHLNSTRRAPASPAVAASAVLTHPGTGAVATSARKTTATAPLAAVTTSPTITTTPSPPGPLSPIARLIGLPGHIVNTVLQALDITVAADGPQSPLDFAPIDELLFAVFRRIEHAAGLDATPTAQPVPPSMTYTGPTTAPTPTVAQFLNAAAAAYVLEVSRAGCSSSPSTVYR